MTAARPGPAPEDARRFASVVAIDVRERVLRIASWVLLASVIVGLPLTFIVSSYVAWVPLALFVAWVPLTLTRGLRLLGPHPGSVEIRDGALTLTVEHWRRGHVTRRYALADVKRGFRTDDEVRLQTRRGETLSIRVDDATMGEELLRAAGQDARQRVLEMPIASLASRVPGATALAWVLLVFQALPGSILAPIVLAIAILERQRRFDFEFALAWTVVEACLLAACIKLLRRRQVAVGADGIRFRRFFRARFLPYAEIADVALEARGVALSLRSGKAVRLRTASWWPRRGLDDAALALDERIETARAGAAPPHDVRAKLPLLDRRGRAADAWRAHLAGLLGKAGYRTGALTARDLGCVIEDASLSAEHRVAAAVALSSTEPEEARSRVRIAAAACADDDLRAALDRAAEGELDEDRLDRLALRVRG